VLSKPATVHMKHGEKRSTTQVNDTNTFSGTPALLQALSAWQSSRAQQACTHPVTARQ
jgi:hypothetical protein